MSVHVIAKVTTAGPVEALKICSGNYPHADLIVTLYYLNFLGGLGACPLEKILRFRCSEIAPEGIYLHYN